MDVFDGEDGEDQSGVVFGGPVDLFLAFGHLGDGVCCGGGGVCGVGWVVGEVEGLKGRGLRLWMREGGRWRARFERLRSLRAGEVKGEFLKVLGARMSLI